LLIRYLKLKNIKIAHTSKVWAIFVKNKTLDNTLIIKRLYIKSVGAIGFEPMTSALSRQRSKPTELSSEIIIKEM
jgi:hypothetical protein